jgi:glycosyltransferase involved in cell wall biosynthesis
MRTGKVVHVVVPEGVDDPTTPSGGNVYDRRLCEELTRSGWTVGEHAATDTLTGVLAGLPDGAVTLVDGLVAVAAPDELVREAHRLRIVVLLHMPFGERDAEARAAEGRVLSVAAAVVTTSEWSRGWVLEHYGLRSSAVHVAAPGVDPADLASTSEAGARLLCVAAVTRDKGHDVLLAALAEVADLPWRLTCVGSLSRDRELAERMQRRTTTLGIADRVTWTGPLSRDELDKAYAAADVLVSATLAESWGMVVTESLARGIPVLATEVGGLSEALGTSQSGARPGVLVQAGDVSAMSDVLREWLESDVLRSDLRAAARSRRTTLAGWPVTAAKVAAVLEEVAR